MRSFILPACAAFFLAAILPASAQPAPAAQPTVGQLLASCTTNAQACPNAVSTVVLNNDGSLHYCVAATLDDYTRPVTDWLKAHPEDANMRQDDGIKLALSTVYAC